MKNFYIHHFAHFGGTAAVNSPSRQEAALKRLRLGPEEQILVAENIRLAFDAQKKKPLRINDTEEAESEALFVLCRAAKGYKGHHNGKPIRFSTFFFRCWMNYRNNMHKALMREKYGNNKRHASFQSNPSFAELAEPESNIGSPLRIAIQAEEAAILHRSISKLKPRTREVLQKSMAGDSFSAIGKQMNLSRERVRQIVEVAKKKLKADLERVWTIRHWEDGEGAV